jgi:hypothetical protein
VRAQARARGGQADGRAVGARLLPCCKLCPAFPLPSFLLPLRARSRLQRATLSKVVTEAFAVAAGDVIRIKWHARPGGASPVALCCSCDCSCGALCPP